VKKLLVLFSVVFMVSCDTLSPTSLSLTGKEPVVQLPLIPEIRQEYPIKNPDKITIKGSTTIAPVMEKLIWEFEKNTKNYAFHLEPSGSLSAIEALKANEADMIMTSISMNEHQKFDFHTNNLDIVELYLGGDALAIIVNVNNKARGMTRELVKEIFTGNRSEWEVTTGLDKKIHLFGRDSTAGTAQYFKEHILDNEPFAETMIPLKNSKAIMDSVRRYRNAIGFVSFAQLNYAVEPLDISFDQGQTFVKLRNEQVENFQYKFVRPLYLYYKAETYHKLKPFIDFIKSEKGKDIICDQGYIPVSSSLISGKLPNEIQ
jgi:phosphate transport system substrate-binding protein